ncbi:MAG: nicotinate-nicotinamide nucleotide adenylyltransferase [Myxococcota bacterium]|nr:nicotinate-nicotinamide nucleotide adenylyltransferase [Myxococcota bacterium]
MKALEIEQDNQTFRLVSADEELGSARIIFGGSFDPPHRGHRALLDCLLTRFPQAKISLIPVHHHAFGKKLTPFSSRVSWCKALAADLSERIEVDDIESRLDGRSISTARYFHEQEPTVRLVWAIGSDLLPTLSTWGEAAALSQLVEFCVFQRGGEPIDERQAVSPLVMPQISSTELRRDLRQGRVMESGLPAALKPLFLKENPYLDQTDSTEFSN